MAQPGGEHVYATLFLSDSYLPGALVLAHSLRDAGTSKKLAVLVTIDAVSVDAITQLKTVYDYVIPVPRLRNDHPANLYLMNRGDLHSAFTKINLWRQTQFSKIVYIDADVVAYRAPDELFHLPHAFSAAPDIGWPDLFNSGVMALTPNMGDYYAMLAMAERGISFDGADQGLLNMHFKSSFNRLSFTYNVTPSAHYQYLPAYRHFQSSISMVHFIGSNKPWFAGRDAPFGNSPYDEMVGRWWAVYDRHYRVQESKQAAGPSIAHVQYFTKGEFHPSGTTAHPSGNDSQHQGQSGHVRSPGEPHQPQASSAHEWQQHRHETASPHAPEPQTMAPTDVQPETQSHQAIGQNQPPAEAAPEPHHIAMHSWDAQRQPPPADSKPEAINFPSTHYEMSRDATPFKPPARYPSPPKDMWYEVPKEAPSPSAHKTKTVFPWEGKQPTPSRSFAYEEAEPPSLAPPSGETSDRSTADTGDEPVTPTGPATPTINFVPSNPWTSFMRSNAWDEVPEISRYVDTLQKHRRGPSLTSLGVGGSASLLSPGGAESSARRKGKPRGFKLTDFPSEAERPSLPVTPAPQRRPSFWGTDEDTSDAAKPQLPTAEGVPTQTDWVCVHGIRWTPADCPCNWLTDEAFPDKDPAEQLQKLAKLQSEALLRKLGGDDEGEEQGGVSRGIPSRPLPFGSEFLMSPTHFAQPAPDVLSPRPVKADATTANLMRKMSDEDLDGDHGQDSQDAAAAAAAAETAEAVLSPVLGVTET